MLDDDGGIETCWHGNSRVRKLPVHAANPRAGIGIAVLEVLPTDRDGVHAARKNVRRFRLRQNIARQHAPLRLGKAHQLHAVFDSSEIAQLQNSFHRLLARKLDVLGMVTHEKAPFDDSQRIVGTRNIRTCALLLQLNASPHTHCALPPVELAPNTVLFIRYTV